MDRAVFDKTAYKSKEYAFFWWSPIQWSLPIKKQIVEIILPIEIPLKYKKARMIKDDLVNRYGVMTGENTVSNRSKWIYYPSMWKGKNYLSIHSEKNNLYPNEKESLDLYIPYRYVATGAEGGDYAKGEFRVGKLIEEGGFTLNSALLNVELIKA